MLILPVTLSAVAAAAVINIWLTLRISNVRHRLKIYTGDGGNEILERRMRAQLNFAENTPIVLILLGVIELARMDNPWLIYVGAIYSLARLLHGFGMDGDGLVAGRMIGTLITMVTQLGLAIWAISIVADM